ncbi:hypothetical protein [Terrisporobacter sp.]|nr:hypothetical protein [Terrisporobacter sp.]
MDLSLNYLIIGRFVTILIIFPKQFGKNHIIRLVDMMTRKI